MKLDWYTLLATDGISNAGTSVLWSEHGFYQWINSTTGVINQNDPNGVLIEFFPRPGKARVLRRIGLFTGPSKIEQAEDAVQRDIREMIEQDRHEFVSASGSEFCDVCNRSCIGHE